MNFWIPSGRNFRVLEPGWPLFFRVKGGIRAIGGFGLFVHFTRLPLWLAWEAFGDANGAPDLETLVQRVAQYRTAAERRQETLRAEIGCIVLEEAVFFGEEDFVAEPRDWAPGIMSGKAYPLLEGEGARIWRECLDRLRHSSRLVPVEGEVVPPPPDRVEIGAGAFRTLLLDAYGRACAVTEEHSLPVLDAVVIRPQEEGSQYEVSNGIVLRSDLHRLFDTGYVTITPDYRLEVSRRLHEDWRNGRSYYPLHGRRIRVPEEAPLRPDPQALRWHNEAVFLG